MFENESLGRDLITVAILGAQRTAAVHVQHLQPRAANGRGAIVRDVEVERAVPVQVGECERCGAEFFEQPRVALSKLALTVIEKTARPAADGVHEQIQITVAIEIGERRAGRVLIRAGHARARGDVCKLPAAQISVERATALQPREENVATPVAIHVAQRDTRADEANLILRHAPVGKVIGEMNSGGRFSQRGEAGLAAAGNGQCRVTRACVRAPFRLRSANQRGQKQEGDESAHGHFTLAVSQSR